MNIHSSRLSLLILIGWLPMTALARCDDRLPENTPIRDFVLKDDGTATHVKTGLIWARCSLGQVWQAGACAGIAQKENYFGAFEAVKRANNEQYLGFNTWHLPTVDELRSIVEFHCANPAVNEVVFPNTPASWFWSASPYGEFPYYGQPVDFGNGNDDIWYKITYEAFQFPVRLVRKAQAYDSQALGLDADDDGVSDMLEVAQGTNPKLKDNDIVRDERFIAQLYRDLYLREATDAEVAQQVQFLKINPDRVGRVVALASVPEFQQQQLAVAVMLALVVNNQIPPHEWLNEWRDSLHKGSSVEALVEAFMRTSDFRVTYADTGKRDYVLALGRLLLGRDLNQQEREEGEAGLQTMSRANFTAHWLTTLAMKKTPMSQLLVIYIADLLAKYPLDYGLLTDLSRKLDGGQLTPVVLIRWVLDSEGYKKRFSLNTGRV